MYTDVWGAFCNLCDEIGEEQAAMEIINGLDFDTLGDMVEWVAKSHDVDMSDYEEEEDEDEEEEEDED